MNDEIKIPLPENSLDFSQLDENNRQSLAAKPARTKKKQGGKGVVFKSGYDPRRWMKGRGIKSPEQREGEEILRTVIWEELSREFDAATMKPLESTAEIDAMRLMVRSWIKKKPNEIADRIAGAVTKNVDVKSDGKPLNWKEFIGGNAESDNKQP